MDSLNDSASSPLGDLTAHWHVESNTCQSYHRSVREWQCHCACDSYLRMSAVRLPIQIPNDWFRSNPQSCQVHPSWKISQLRHRFRSYAQQLILMRKRGPFFSVERSLVSSTNSPLNRGGWATMTMHGMRLRVNVLLVFRPDKSDKGFVPRHYPSLQEKRVSHHSML